MSNYPLYTYYPAIRRDNTTWVHYFGIDGLAEFIRNRKEFFSQIKSGKEGGVYKSQNGYFLRVYLGFSVSILHKYFLNSMLVKELIDDKILNKDNNSLTRRVLVDVSCESEVLQMALDVLDLSEPDIAANYIYDITKT